MGHPQPKLCRGYSAPYCLLRENWVDIAFLVCKRVAGCFGQPTLLTLLGSLQQSFAREVYAGFHELRACKYAAGNSP